MCSGDTQGSITTFAVKDPAGRKALLVVDYAGPSRTIVLDVKGVSPDAKVSCTLLDHLHDLEPLDIRFNSRKLTLVKPDFHSAAFLVKFEE